MAKAAGETWDASGADRNAARHRAQAEQLRESLS